MISRHAAALPLLCLAALPTVAQEWRMLDDSTFTFETTFEDTTLPGRFERFEVALDFDPRKPGDGRLRVTVDLAAANMDDPDINEAIAGPEWFDVAAHPQAVYESDEIVERAPGQFVARGVLTLKGKCRPVEVPFSWLESADTTEMRGELTLARTDFDVGSGEWATDEQIGVDVRLQFALRLKRDD
ncbi:MAG: YceI family protein [Woeseiaceae bacterium]